MLRIQGDFPSHHQPDQFLRMHVAAEHRSADLAAAQHGDPVGDFLHFIHFMRDKDHCTAGGGHFFHIHEQFRGFLRRQHRRRLVQNQDARTAIQHPDDFHPLLLAHGQLPYRRVRVDGQAEPFLKLVDFGADPGVGKQKRALTLAQLHVLGHGEGLHQFKMLVYHADARRDRLAGRSKRAGGPVDQNLAGIRPVQASQHRHDRAFSRTVLAQQRVNLAGVKVEIHMVIGDNARKCLNNSPHLHQRLRHLFNLSRKAKRRKGIPPGSLPSVIC